MLLSRYRGVLRGCGVVKDKKKAHRLLFGGLNAL